MFLKQINKKISTYQDELVKTHYAEVEHMYTQIRGWRHDYKNHIQVLKIYADKGDLTALKSYLDELDRDLSTIDTVLKTGNKMADAILNSKIALAKSHNINVIAQADISIELKTSSIDLCVILGNLFDNAIEASLSLPEEQRLIRIYMNIKGRQLYISFTNFTNRTKLQKYMGTFKSTKGAKGGLGTIRIDGVVKKLNGYLRRNSEDGAFTTELLLP